MGTINRLLEMIVSSRADYYPYGMPHGNASGAGLNSRKYSGKELITFAGYDAMDYHARWRPTTLPLFTTPDPMAEKRPGVSLYTYCSGDPVNKVDFDGCDEWDISPSGHIVRTVATTEHDAFFVLDEDGNRIEEKSISFDYGTVENVDLNQGGGSLPYDLFQLRGDENGCELFEFLSQNIPNEFSIIQAGIEGEQGLNYVSTSHSYRPESGMTQLFSKKLRHGYNIRAMNHSHPDDNGIPSGIYYPEKPDKGDIQFAETVINHSNSHVSFHIYLPKSNRYVKFTDKTKPSDFNLPPTYLEYKVLFGK